MLQPGHFAANRERTKKAKYSQAASILGASFTPRVLETYGQLGISFVNFVKKLGRVVFRMATNTDVDEEQHFRTKLKPLWLNRISGTLQKANDRLFLSKASRNQQFSPRGAPRFAVDFYGVSNWAT